jgi:CD63 antigen
VACVGLKLPNCTRTFLTLFSFLPQISGLGILIAGIVVLNDVDDFNHFLDGRITAPPIILIVTGLMIFVIAFLGCYGALKESPKLLMAVS